MPDKRMDGPASRCLLSQTQACALQFLTFIFRFSARQLLHTACDIWLSFFSPQLLHAASGSKKLRAFSLPILQSGLGG